MDDIGATRLAGKPRIRGFLIDIGAYEYQEYISVSIFFVPRNL
ncbi:Uncharacterized protein dnm_021590 [Desulfonema magnum]|uniref:Uncharacterized protein n=1 Tax=Desulfonema magnum TaxID=45655 RepID=A0A975BIU9_9BACT|nr:Uncharacterized protein dnm_021590 [Desulfonema magnum]